MFGRTPRSMAVAGFTERVFICWYGCIAGDLERVFYLRGDVL